MNDPLLTVERLKHGDDLGIPPLQRIIEVKLPYPYLLIFFIIIYELQVPKIDWSKYNITVPPEDLKSGENETVHKDIPKIETVSKASQKKKVVNVDFFSKLFA